MSSQKGNVSRTRTQKYKNKTAFRNDLHDKSAKIKAINSMAHDGVCERCKAKIEWKVKYKKYKPLTQAATCIVCKNKTVKRAYHTMCLPCAGEKGVCAKCNEKKGIVIKSGPSEEEKKAEEVASNFELMHLTERKRRTVLRLVEKGETLEEALTSVKKDDDDDDDFLDEYFEDTKDETDSDSESENDLS